jgi:opacity protein-like surface antigen
MYRPLLLASTLLLSATTLFAQEPDSRYEIGASVGSLVYQGDLAPSPAGSYRTVRPMFSAWGARHLSNKLSVRAGLMLGSLHGDDALFETPEWRKQRALSFTAAVTEVSAMAVWDVSGGRTALSPYIFGGVGYAFTRIQRDASHFNTTYFLNDKATEGLAKDLTRTPPKGFTVVPVGAGLRYAVSDYLSVHAETVYRLSHTDYLDGFSQAGNPKLYDHYQSFSVGLSYRFDGFGDGAGRSGQGCPVLRP